MKPIYWLTAAALLLVSAGPQQLNTLSITLVDGEHITTVQTAQPTVGGFIDEQDILLIPEDRLFLNGIPTHTEANFQLNQKNILQIRRASPILIKTPSGQQSIYFSGWTTAEALRQSGFQLYMADFSAPASGLPLNGLQTIQFNPSQLINFRVDGADLTVRSSGAQIGEALASAGIPLIGLDASLPAETASVPPNGTIEINRITESVSLLQSSLPFESQYVASAELELDQENLLQIGEPGLAVSRVRTRFENGEQVSQVIEEESIIRPPQDRIVGYGTRVVEKTLDIGGQTITYWRAIQMYATSYSPCRSGVPGRCFTGTSSGLPVKQGVVAMYHDWYIQLGGLQVYVPGYGTAVIADVGGGFPDRRPWIDLGYSDENYQPWSGWVTVYFLSPVPDVIPYVLE